MCVCLCVCVSVWGQFVSVCLCLCLCVCVRLPARIYIYAHKYSSGAWASAECLCLQGLEEDSELGLKEDAQFDTGLRRQEAVYKRPHLKRDAAFQLQQARPQLLMEDGEGNDCASQSGQEGLRASIDAVQNRLGTVESALLQHGSILSELDSKLSLLLGRLGTDTASTK